MPQLDKHLSEITEASPFGGIQLVICGDFCQVCRLSCCVAVRAQSMFTRTPSHAQLPPIPSRQPPAGAHGVPFLNRGHCFESEAWHSLQFVVKELKYVWRQENRHFVDVLQDIRYGRVTPRVRQFVGSCRRPLKMKKGVIPTKLFCKNRYVAVPTPSVQ